LQYSYAIAASDADGDTLSYSLLSGPAGMSVNSTTGQLTWTPSAAGNEPVSIEVSDGLLAVTQSWVINVVATDVQLIAAVIADLAIADIGDDVTITVLYDGAAGAVNVTATLDGNLLALDTNHQATVSADTIGEHTINATVTDPFESVIAEATFFVRDPADGDPPVVRNLSRTATTSSKETNPSTIRFIRDYRKCVTSLAGVLKN